MSQKATIQRGRLFHERLMSSTATIRRVTDQTLSSDPNSLELDETTEVVYSGKCKIRLPAASAAISERDTLGQNLAFGEGILSLPVVADPETDTGDPGDVHKNDILTIDSNPEDPTMVGRTYRVKRSATQSSATQRRLVVESVE